MANALPDPLVPAHVDLRGFQYMALDVVRVRDSELMDQDPAVIVASFLSWCVSWHQLPAGSLPDDDRALARLLAPHEGIKGWKALRSLGALRGWVKCSDGRLYHPVVCAKALEAYDQKESAKRKRELDAERLRRWRNNRGMTEAEWAKLRAHVFTRDGWKCTVPDCGGVDDLHCDHVKSLEAGGTNDPSNLKTLCRTCHAHKTAQECNGNEMRVSAATSPDGRSVSSPRDQIGSDQIRSDPSLTPPPSPCFSIDDDEPAPVPDQPGPRPANATGHKSPGPTIATTGGTSERKPPASILGQRANALDADALKRAIGSGDPLAVAAVFHVTPGYDEEWLSVTDGMQVGEVATVLAWRRSKGDPVRMPKGFRMALATWKARGLAERRELAAKLLGEFGIVVDGTNDGRAST